MEKRTSLLDNALIWFGAGVSIAEILTGTYFSSLGFGRGLAAILVGHVIGCIMLFLAGVIGGTSRKSAMETTKSSFGSKGGSACTDRVEQDRMLKLLRAVSCAEHSLDASLI